MGSMDQNTSLARLARAVSGRRQRIGSSQDAVTDRGGPSDRTLREIENATATTLTTSTLRKLDQGLLWEPGTALAVLEGTLSSEDAVAARQVVYAPGLGAVAGAAREVQADNSPGEASARYGPSYARQARQGRRVSVRRTAPSHHDPDEGRRPVFEGLAPGRRFRASQPLAEALAALQDIDDPNTSEVQAIDLVWRALRGVMEHRERHADTSPLETSSSGGTAAVVGPVDKVDKAWESKDINEIADAPVDALQGVSDADAQHLKDAFNIKTVRDLGTNKYFLWAQGIAKLAE